MSEPPTPSDPAAGARLGGGPDGGRPADRNDDWETVERLRAGDEYAFAELVRRHHGALVRLAQAYVSDRDTAEGVVQDAWLGVLNGLSQFEGRSSLKTWIFRIVVNRAKTRGTRDKRRRVLLRTVAEDVAEPAVAPTRFDSQGRWSDPPVRWSSDTPEELLLREETQAVLERAIAALPHNQRAVITLRDIHGLDSDEICNILEVSQTNQRVLLHRARGRVRAELERHLAGDDPSC
jgi:RNA polymerase sigma-70 factor (ECF subfamily)